MGIINCFFTSPALMASGVADAVGRGGDIASGMINHMKELFHDDYTSTLDNDD